jgi:hypothetical protein
MHHRRIAPEHALRLGLLAERAAHHRARADLHALKAGQAEAEVESLRGALGLAGQAVSLVLEPGGPHPIGTVLDAHGQPIPLPTKED